MFSDILLILVIIVLSFGLGMMIMRQMQQKKKREEVTSSFLESRLAECSDLTTCNLEYVDLVKYTSGTIPFISKKSFSMIYEANIRAGIDLSLAEVKLAPKSVTIHLPETQIQSIEVNTDTLRFYDEHFALFNWSEKEDITHAIQLARDDVEQHADLEKLKNQARKQAEVVISQLIEPAVEGREIKIV